MTLPGETMVVGDEIAMVSDGDPFTIESVQLVEPDDMGLVASYVVASPIGSMSLAHPYDDWDMRTQAVGSTIGKERVTLAVEIRATAEGEARAATIRVEYSTKDGRTGHNQGSTSIRLSEDCS